MPDTRTTTGQWVNLRNLNRVGIVLQESEFSRSLLGYAKLPSWEGSGHAVQKT